MKKLLFGLLIATIMVGCYPEGPKYVADLDLVLTNYSDTFDFASQNTYYLFPKVAHPENEDLPFDEWETKTWDTEILEKMHENMQQRGYVSVTTWQEADLALTATSFTNTTTNYYYPWYGGGYYWGYPSYGWGYSYSTTFGTVLMEMAFPENFVPEGEMPMVWRGVVNGMTEGSNSSVRARIDDTIDQAFKQSEYIQSNS